MSLLISISAPAKRTGLLKDSEDNLVVHQKLLHFAIIEEFD
jgi:hypothetical protein